MDTTIRIANDFTDMPGGRFREDGQYSGQEFRETILQPAFARSSKVFVNLDGTFGYATSFLEEAFGGLARIYGSAEVRKKINFISEEEPLLIERIWKYIDEA